MKTPYILTLPTEVVKKAEKYAASHQLQLANVLEEYTHFLANRMEVKEKNQLELHDFLDELHQAFDKHIEGDAKKDYRRYLIEKYR